ncbi:transglycosylase SLT domain-containing protein [Sulfitobacter guttiformis]|uniref:transglycosylase SLT domain-containing protein n=1 Tax=Sulfitobacter guttiformis TaxID=74349 RepID=UPI000468AD40|nr:transglycosylase SLT domain-containing protein [Sulfitobacter guttiformis]
MLALMLGLWAGGGFAQTDDVLRPPVKGMPEIAAVLPDTSQTGPYLPRSVAAPVAVSTANAPILNGSAIAARPPARSGYVPRTRWQHMKGNALWTRAAMSALKDHGRPLVEMVPRDIADWCPAYSANDAMRRSAFWVGYMSALAKYESTYKPWAVGGSGQWFGLLQILPATARSYKCNVGTGEALKNGAANLSCAVRIMARTVPRDGVIHGYDSRWRGVSADWGPMRNPAKRNEMATWLKRQNYCVGADAIRPKARP